VPKWIRKVKGTDGQFLKLTGGLPTWADPPAGADHNLLSTTHPDTLPASPVRGDLLLGNSTPKWARGAIGSSNAILKTDGVDPLWGLLVNANVDAAAAIAEAKLALNYATHQRLHALDAALDHSGSITDVQHGSRGSGLHGDSHARSHALDSASDHTGSINDSGHGSRASGLHADSHARQHALDSVSDHTGTITDTQHGSRGSGLHADSHTRLHTMTDALDHTGSINDTQHGSRGSGLHADSHAQLHKDSHKTGGGDAFAAGDLLDATAKTTVRKNTGTDVGSRRRLNLIEGSNVTLTVADDPANEEVDVTVASTGAGPSPSDTVVTEKTFGQSEAPGSATTYSRGDHTHGTPTDPVPGHNVATGVHGVGASYLAKTANATQVLGHGELTGVTADQHHAQVHTLSGSDHTGPINDTQHGSRGSGLHADSHAQLHNTSHQDGGGDEISVAALSGRLADFQPFPALDFYRRVGATADRYYGPMVAGATATAAMTANVIYASPFAVVRTITLDRIAINVTTVAAGATARLGIYADAGTTYPGSLVLDAGTVDVSTTGMKTITISQQLTPGLYWLVVWSGGAPTIRGVAGGGAYPILSLDNTLAAAVYNRYEATLSYTTYPSTFPAGASPGSGAMACPWVRLSA